MTNYCCYGNDLPCVLVYTVHGSHGCHIVHLRWIQHLLPDRHRSAVHPDMVQCWSEASQSLRLPAVHRWRGHDAGTDWRRSPARHSRCRQLYGQITFTLWCLCWLQGAVVVRWLLQWSVSHCTTWVWFFLRCAWVSSCIWAKLQQKCLFLQDAACIHIFQQNCTNSNCLHYHCETTSCCQWAMLTDYCGRCGRDDL